MKNTEMKFEIRDIQQVCINGEKRTLGHLWVYSENNKSWSYDGKITSKGWYKTKRGIINNRLNDGMFL